MVVFANVFTLYEDTVVRTPTFGPAHLTYIAIILAVWIAVPLLLRRRARARNATLYTMAALMLVNEIIRMVWFAGCGVDPAKWLPFDLCGFMIFLTIVTIFVRKPLMLNIVYALGLTAAIFGVLTPSVQNYPPLGYNYFCGMFSHGCLVLAPLILIAAGEFRPDIRKLPAIVCSLVVFALAVIAPLDYAFGANWFFLCTAPADTPLSMFEGWVGHPGYLGLALVLGIVLWTLFYLPFVIHTPRNAQPAPGDAVRETAALKK